MFGDQVADQRHHAGNDLVLGMLAVGKIGVVGDVRISRAGPQLDDLAEHGETAEAGIEDEDVGARGTQGKFTRVAVTIQFSPAVSKATFILAFLRLPGRSPYHIGMIQK